MLYITISIHMLYITISIHLLYITISIHMLYITISIHMLYIQCVPVCVHAYVCVWGGGGGDVSIYILKFFNTVTTPKFRVFQIICFTTIQLFL